MGFGTAANLASTRRPLGRSQAALQSLAQEIYHDAQKLDEWPGEDYSGTSVLAGMKAATALGLVKTYRWAFGLQDVLHALSWVGPVEIGVNWYTGMFSTDGEGFLHATGKVEGGHCTLLSGINPDAATVTITNSWGSGWGRNGQALLSWDDLDLLLRGGEAVTVLKPVVKP